MGHIYTKNYLLFNRNSSLAGYPEFLFAVSHSCTYGDHQLFIIVCTTVTKIVSYRDRVSPQ